MPLGTFTYENVVNQVKNWIKSNCVNITNFAGINGSFKSGWSTSGTVLTSPQYTGTYSVGISRYVSQVTTATVDTDMTNFCNTYGISSRLSQNIPANEFYHFIQDMISFICTKCVYTVGQYAQSTRYLIYYTGNTSYGNTFTISTTDTKRLAQATDATSLMTTMFDIVGRNIRCIPVTYSWSFSA